jgi:hypothetical protein
MVNVEIYRQDNQITHIKFHRQFMILVKDGQLFWKYDGKVSSPAKGGVIHIWIRLKADGQYNLDFVRAEWALSVDGQSFPSDFYLDIEVDQHIIELKYEEYRFVITS